MADWFKFYNDGLDSKGMQFAMSEQPLVTSVWLVIMSEASKSRSCRLKWSDKDFEMIGFARKINVSVPVFNQCIGLLERIEYLTRTDGHIEIHGWERLQSDYARGMDRGYYKKNSKTLASNSEVSTVRREEKRREEIRKDKRENNASLPLADIQQVFDEWNKMASKSGLPQCLLFSDKRRRSLVIRLGDPFFKSNWMQAMERVSKSPFCRGESERGWRASLDWFITPDAVVKLMEGKYNAVEKKEVVQNGY